MRFKKPGLRSRFAYYVCHWCKKYSSSKKKWTWKHEDRCIDNPSFIDQLRKQYGLIKND